MKTVFLPKASIKPLEKNFLPKDSLVLIGSGYVEHISLDDELRASSHLLRGLCSLSIKSNITFLCPTKIFCKGKIFFGTVVIDNGRLLGISDATHSVDGEYSESNFLRVFETSKGRLGIVSGDDLYFFEVSRLMKLWECDCLIFGVTRLTQKEKTLAKAQGYINETTSIIFSDKQVLAFNYRTLDKKGNLMSIVTKSEKGLIEKRKRDLYRDLIIR
jgi:hypothetical protein